MANTTSGTTTFGKNFAIDDIVEEAFEYLDAPIERVGSKDTPVPYASDLENEILVQTSWIEFAIKKIIEF